jgi:hypothetical protein
VAQASNAGGYVRPLKPHVVRLRQTGLEFRFEASLPITEPAPGSLQAEKLA